MSDTLREICERTTALVAGLPGPVRRVSVRSAEHAVEIEWPGPADPGQAAPPSAQSAQSAPAAEHTEAAEETELIRTPVVGTFYHAPAPGAEPFVTVGSLVEAGQVVGIVEAMKLLNDIVAERAGRVAEICAANAEPVEFGQPLVRLERAGAAVAP
jgi:acetyl-CoA carboxylase biotin carboxyl carrier protein